MSFSSPQKLPVTFCPELMHLCGLAGLTVQPLLTLHFLIDRLGH